MDQGPRHASLDQLVLRWLRLLPRGHLGVRAAFATFVRRSPRHLFTYLRLKSLETELSELDPDRRIDVEALIAKARSGDGVVVRTHRTTPQHALPREASPAPQCYRLAAPVAYVIALLAIAASPILIQRRTLPHETYATAIGEQREVTLPDKTRFLLNTNSKVVVDYTVSKREVHVLEGEVIITVHHQSRWPVPARVGDELVQDWGTQFDIRVLPRGSSVVVTQGAVLVRHVQDVLLERVGPP